MKSKARSEKAPLFIFSSPIRSTDRGFTLVELIIVIGVLAVLVSLAVPPTLRARAHANETATIGNLRTLSNANEAYRTAQEPPAYSPDLASLINSNPPYLDASWSSGQRQGYSYTYVASGDQSTYSTNAAPQISNISGINSYCVDHTGVLRRYPAGQGGENDPTGCSSSGAPI